MNERTAGIVSRRGLLGCSGAVAAGSIGGDIAAAANPPMRGMNVVLFLTDQERAIQHFPPGWEQRHLPGLSRLKANGLAFENAFTNACMCSPARSTLLTGFFPAQHGVKYTLEEDMPAAEYPQVQLPLDLPNIATVMKRAGYNVVYKGKWHCSKPAGDSWVPEDLARYGFDRWDPQDAGENQDLDQAGGGTADNDGRFMTDDGPWRAGREGVIPYLLRVASRQQPFFLIVSLVNPHDVLFYPKNYLAAGYGDSWLDGAIDIPATVAEDLATKPTVQRQFLAITQAMGPLPTPAAKRAYLNFYGNLMRASDARLVSVLDALQSLGLAANTLVIRTADHGEMGLTHGGQRQKNFNMYEESIRVPLVYSNPRLYPRPQSTRALVSHVDFLPTLAGLFGGPRTDWAGVDYSQLVAQPNSAPVQDPVVFTYDDYQSGQANGPYPTPPNHIVAIREKRFKIAEYYDVDGKVPSRWEMYDLLNDPLETINLAAGGLKGLWNIRGTFERLRRKLAEIKKRRLQPLAASPVPR